MSCFSCAEYNSKGSPNKVNNFLTYTCTVCCVLYKCMWGALYGIMWPINCKQPALACQLFNYYMYMYNHVCRPMFLFGHLPRGMVHGLMNNLRYNIVGLSHVHVYNADSLCRQLFTLRRIRASNRNVEKISFLWTVVYKENRHFMTTRATENSLYTLTCTMYNV